MIKYIIPVYLISIYLSLPGLFSKAGYNALLGLIPFYNIYLLIQILEINPIFLGIVSLGLIFLPFREYIATLILVFIPFMIADAYDKNMIYGILGFVLPFIMLPYIGYFSGAYRYDMED